MTTVTGGAPRVVLVHDNRAIASGTHEDLLLDSPDYRRVVTRAMDAAEEVSSRG